MHPIRTDTLVFATADVLQRFLWHTGLFCSPLSLVTKIVQYCHHPYLSSIKFIIMLLLPLSLFLTLKNYLRILCKDTVLLWDEYKIGLFIIFLCSSKAISRHSASRSLASLNPAICLGPQVKHDVTPPRITDFTI